MNYHDITKDDMLNGEGIRTTLFVAGCDHKCENCHNPQTWAYNSGIPFDKAAMEEIIDNLSEDYCEGLTISGGDALAPANIKTVSEIIETVRLRFLNEKTIWVYTGYTYDELKNMRITEEEWFKLIDILVDGRFEYDKLDVNLPFRGSSNQNVWDLKRGVKLYV